MIRPPRFFAIRSWSSIAGPTLPEASSNMLHVSLAISAARRPALALKSTMTRLRWGCRVVARAERTDARSVSERILACLPAIAAAVSRFRDQSSRPQAVVKYSISTYVAMRHMFISALLHQTQRQTECNNKKIQSLRVLQRYSGGGDASFCRYSHFWSPFELA